MIQGIKSNLAEWLASKKVKTMLASWIAVGLTYVAAFFATKFSVDVDPAWIEGLAFKASALISGTAITYIGGQSQVDKGLATSEKERIKQDRNAELAAVIVNNLKEASAQ